MTSAQEHTWNIGTLCSVIDHVIDYRGKTPPISESGIPVISAANIKGGQVVLDGRYVSQETYAAWTTRGFIKAGDVLFTTEAPVGEIAQLPGDQTYLITRRVIALQISPAKASEKYIKYYLSSNIPKSTFNNIAHGATVPRLYKDDILSLEIPIPPLPIQKKIASILSAYDDLIENNTRRIKILEELAQSIYREWFVHFRYPGHENVPMVDSELGKIPQGWEVGVFTDIANVLSGGTPKTKVDEYWHGDIPFFTPKDASESFVVLTSDKHISELGLDNCSSSLYPEDTVFVTARGTVGKVVLNIVPMAMNQSCYALSSKTEDAQLHLFFLTRYLRPYLQQNTSGATFDTIIVDTFRRLPVKVPPSNLMRSFNDAVLPIVELVKRCSSKNQTLRKTRDLLLPRLVSGRLNVEDLDIAV